MYDDSDQKKILKTMLAAERWDRRDIRNMLTGYSDREIELRIWHAQETIRVEHGIIFGVTPLHPGVYRRLREADQVASQAGRQRRAGLARISRAADKLRQAATMTDDEKEKERLQRSADRTAERLLWRKKKD